MGQLESSTVTIHYKVYDMYSLLAMQHMLKVQKFKWTCVLRAKGEFWTCIGQSVGALSTKVHEALTKGNLKNGSITLVFEQIPKVTYSHCPPPERKPGIIIYKV